MCVKSGYLRSRFARITYRRSGSPRSCHSNLGCFNFLLQPTPVGWRFKQLSRFLSLFLAVDIHGPTAISLSLLLLCCAPTFTHAFDYSSWQPWRRAWRRSSGTTRNVPAEGYYDPLASGGSFLTLVPMTFPLGQGEPINAIISGNSDTRVLQDTETNGGLRNYFLSFGFSGECLGQHSGSDQEANLGDGNGYLNETSVIRWNYGDPQLGSCTETIQGGNHFRYWVQNGPNGNRYGLVPKVVTQISQTDICFSGAIFLAVSYELPLTQEHDIIVNGYNLGRDWLIGNITRSTVPTLNVTNGTTFTASTSFANFTYQTHIQYVSGLLEDTNIGINHNLSVGTATINASDGLVAVLNVTLTGTPPKSIAWRPSPPQLWQVYPLFIVFLSLAFS
ncbi:hypothetical protein BDZ97DRAFT_1732534 [Flammula alnicola]|nr:hypothetical protein BDZ97DRAFT_1732534 [Flammula alnicola]